MEGDGRQDMMKKIKMKGPFQSRSRLTRSLGMIACCLYVAGLVLFLARNVFISAFRSDDTATVTLSILPSISLSVAYALTVVSALRYKKECGHEWTKKERREWAILSVMVVLFFLVVPNIHFD
jgi:uncharacterized membrane protein YidH (DUF202 family)